MVVLPDTLGSYLAECDALIIVPPFAGLDRPALGAHVLQACARAQGFDVRVLYANMLLAREIGESEYVAICFASTSNLLGERFFARAAYGLSPKVFGKGENETMPERRNRKKHAPPMGWRNFAELAGSAENWADVFAGRIVPQSFGAIGCTTTFEQTAASFALLSRIKRIYPESVTILGGANCEGPMADGILSLGADIDYVFSGESEVTFPAFLTSLKKGTIPDSSVIHGSPCRAMNGVPTPDFTEYYTQLKDFLPNSKIAQSGNIWLPYESSRGCWWGQKHHCTFCGINGKGMVFRQKTPDRVISELQLLLKQHPTNKVCMVDNIMPYDYFKSLLPRLNGEVPGAHIFYEQKANLTFDRVQLLKSAGVSIIQPGIEALSTPLLKLMKKGVSAAQNIALLRYARTADLAVNWNLLYAFPGDRLEWYEETAALLPLLAHLNPPTGLCHLSIDRFSPYFDLPEDYGIQDIRPIAPYFDVLPPQVDHSKIAYHFTAEYKSESRTSPNIIREIESLIATWRERWRPEEQSLPALEVAPISNDTYMLVDTRNLAGCLEFEFIDVDHAAMALVGRNRTPSCNVVEWALKRKVCVELDGKFVPLATAPAHVLRTFESDNQNLPRTDLEIQMGEKLSGLATGPPNATTPIRPSH